MVVNPPSKLLSCTLKPPFVTIKQPLQLPFSRSERALHDMAKGKVSKPSTARKGKGRQTRDATSRRLVEYAAVQLADHDKETTQTPPTGSEDHNGTDAGPSSRPGQSRILQLVSSNDSKPSWIRSSKLAKRIEMHS